MYATKENCEKALEALKAEQPTMRGEHHNIIYSLLCAALKCLPSQDYVDRDKSRKKYPQPTPGLQTRDQPIEGGYSGEKS